MDMYLYITQKSRMYTFTEINKYTHTYLQFLPECLYVYVCM